MVTFTNICINCNGKLKKYFYPDIYFNNKFFKYFECINCKSIQLNPLPGEDEFKLMYGLNDHTYLKNELKINYNQESNKKNHQNIQLFFFDKFKYYEGRKTLLDYGCGSGFYMNHAQKMGVECTGIEFNEEFTSILQNKTQMNITTLNKIGDKKFDIIHIGHVLEHLTNPIETLETLKNYAHSNTIFIIDGPLENNFCLSRLIIKLGSYIKQKKFINIAPQHITLNNYKSQLIVFNSVNFKTINYEISEVNFPLPEKLELKNPIKASLFFLALFSKFVSKLNTNWGNIFHYAGKL